MRLFVSEKRPAIWHTWFQISCVKVIEKLVKMMLLEGTVKVVKNLTF